MKKLSLLGAALILIALSVLVWPTRYRYDRVIRPGYGPTRTEVLVRIDRFSGKAEYLSQYGWLKFAPTYRASP